ncbi:cytochrome c-550 PedF [Pelagibius marinus]|uniref:cytochrome c-550 PedF n=1 Tax=Pelagibius marinus TaxID=2762760 RepID=UPI001872ED34|nr:cytochrome c-550 PedF [Pelagibius marinus]
MLGLTSVGWYRGAFCGLATLVAATLAYAHGDVAPQPVNTDALPDVGEEWLTENPYRNMGEEVWQKAVDIGASGFNQNCARCHGLGAVSGGLAPDLRYLEAEEYGDEWFVERFRHGYTQNGTTKMPAFGELLGQKAGWAIRTYIETRPDEGALGVFSARLKEIRDQLVEWSQEAPGDAAAAESVKQELLEIAANVVTGSGAPLADSVAYRAALVLDGSVESWKSAAEALTVGLSVAE